MFDTDTFLNQETKKAFSTTIKQAPEGEYVGMIEELEVRTGVKNDNAWCMLNLKVSFDAEEVVNVTGRNPTNLYYALFLDLTEEGGLDESEGKNVGLGRIRAALDQNDPKKAWSPSMLKGQPLTWKVIHKLDEEGEIKADLKSFRSVE